LLVVVGPTAVGKTAYSLHLAERMAGEIVSADSRLFYVGMDIGTAKPTPEERARVPHHLIDLCRPDQAVSLGQYLRLAHGAIAEVHGRGRLPILVGGSGQYVRAVIEGWSVPEVPPNVTLRQALERLGRVEAGRWLRALDDEAAGRIDPRNLRRVVRALEVILVTGRPISRLQRKRPPDYDIRIIGLTCDREELYRRIDARVDQMMARGLLDEVRGLVAAGYGCGLPSMTGLGYRQLCAFLNGELELEEAVRRIKFETHRFARQQHAWFRPGMAGIEWIEAPPGNL
jgi:tRNA dimethylallyltransferase